MRSIDLAEPGHGPHCERDGGSRGFQIFLQQVDSAGLPGGAMRQIGLRGSIGLLDQDGRGNTVMNQKIGGGEIGDKRNRAVIKIRVGGGDAAGSTFCIQKKGRWGASGGMGIVFRMSVAW